jgi:nucleotide-binding universal stress UspA family protein
MFKKVLVTTDGSSRAEKAADYAIGLAKSCDAELHVLSVVDSGSPRTAMEIDPDYVEEIEDSPNIDVDQVEEDRKKPEKQFAGRLIEKAKSEGVKATPFIKVGNPSDEIISTALENSDDVIVIGSHGRSPMGAALVGSVASSVVHAGDLPVLVIPVHDKD